MRDVLEIRKLFWLINAVLLTILIYIVVSFSSGDDAGKSTFVDPIPMKEEVEIITCKNPLPPSKHKIIVERNIFGSSGLSPVKENRKREKADEPASILRAQLRLIATVAGDDQVACAVIENLKSKIQEVYKAGDVIEGAQIERIGRNKIFLFYGEKSEVLNLCITREVFDPVEKDEEPVVAQRQNAVESVNAISPAEGIINKKAYVAQVHGMEAFLENMNVAPYIVNEKEEGLCITGLDDLNMAGYFGFENGDVIQTINGQTLTDKQKAFQVLKKARSQSSLNCRLLRNKQTMDLSFEVK